MLTDEQWLDMTRCRQPRRRAASVGPLVHEFIRSKGHQDQGLVAEVKAAVHQVVDESFRKHSRAVTMTGSTVTITIDDPALLYEFRRKYLFALREHLAAAVPRAKVCDVRFAVSC
jgi:hypothetical protein